MYAENSDDKIFREQYADSFVYIDIDSCTRRIWKNKIQIRTDHYVTVDEMASCQQNVSAMAG